MPLFGINQSLKRQKSYEFYLETFVSKIDFTIGGSSVGIPGWVDGDLVRGASRDSDIR